MKNRITKSVPFLVASTGKAIGGLTLYATELETKYINAALLSAKLEALFATDQVYQQARIELKRVRAELYALTATARKFVYVTRDVSKPFLGNTYSSEWEAFGLKGSMEVPRPVDVLVPLLGTIDGYLVANPGRENAVLGATAARAEELRTGLSAAVNAVNHQLDVVSRLYSERDAAASDLQAALRLLLKELGILFDPLDSRWISFGFNKPGAQQTPDQPENVSVTMVDEETAAIKWDRSPRAKSYRVRAKVVGTDAEAVLVGSPKDPDFTLETLPRNGELEVTIAPVNRGGEGVMTSVIIRMAGLEEKGDDRATIVDSQFGICEMKREA